MSSKVAVMRFGSDAILSLRHTLAQLGGIDDINSASRPVVVKVGVFGPKDLHTSVRVADAIVKGFENAPSVFLAESDNYRGTGSERLQIWKELFNSRVMPFNLSEDSNTIETQVADETIGLSHILFKPNVLVSTHILRSYDRGSILKNLLGLIPDKKKARFHKKLAPALADIFEAIGGIDLAVMDGTYFWQGSGSQPVQMGTLLVGRDAVAVEAVGGILAGLKLEKMPVLQEFVRRGLGEGDLRKIEILGASFADLKEEFDQAAKRRKKSRPRSQGPTTWGGRSFQAFKNLTEEGFFNLPDKKTLADVVRALESKGIPTKGRENKIALALARRVKNGTLRTSRGENERVYWIE